MKTDTGHAGQWRLDYHDPMTGKWPTRFFSSEEELKRFIKTYGIDTSFCGNGRIRRVRPEAEIKKDGYEYGFLGRDHPCPDCGSKMLGRIKSYPPYCDSTYEEHECPECGYGEAMSA